MLDLLADDQMPGVDACAARLRDRAGQVPALRIRRHPGRPLPAGSADAADWLLVRSVTRVDETLLAHSRVRFVGTATIGVDHVDLDWLAARGIVCAAAPGCNARAVAEWVVASLVRQAARLGQALAGRTLGIVGVGHVGSQVALLARALDLRLLACDPGLDAAARAATGIAPADWRVLDDLIAEADILTLHTPLTRTGPDATLGLLDAARLARLRPGSWLLNAGRGEVIDNAALAVRLAAAGDLVVILDVWAGEPLPLPALLARVAQAGPHIAGHSLEGKWRGTWQIMAAAATAEGWRLDGTLADILPAAGGLHLEAPPGGDVLSRLQGILAQVIDLAGDDARLRAARAGENPGAAFDALRKGYGLRREFPAHVVTLASGDALMPVLAALGFQVVARASTESTPSA